MNQELVRLGKEILKVGFKSFFKKIAFISIHLLFIPYPVYALLRQTCETALYATEFKYSRYYSVVSFSLPLGDDLASTTFSYSSTWKSGTEQISISK